MNCWCVPMFLTVLAATLTGFASEPTTEVKFLRPVQYWQGKFQAKIPEGVDPGGSIFDLKTFQKFWQRWRGAEPVPNIDFQTHFVVVRWFAANGKTPVDEALRLNVCFTETALPPLAKWNFTGGKTANDFIYVLAVYSGKDLPVVRPGPRDGIKKVDTPASWKHGPSVFSVTFSPDSRTFASASSDGTIKLWDIGTRKLKTTLKGSGSAVLSLAFSPDSKTLAATGKDNTIRLWDISKGHVTATFPGEVPDNFLFSPIHFSPDGKTLVSLGKKVHLWDVKTQKKLPALEESDSIHNDCSALSPDGELFAAAVASDAIQFWHVSTGKKASTLSWQNGDGHSLSALVFSPDGKILATGTQGGEVRLLNVAFGKTSKILGDHRSNILGLRFSPDGKTLAVGSKEESIKLWEVKSGTPVAKWEGNTGYGITFSTNLHWAAAYEGRGDLFLWDLRPDE